MENILLLTDFSDLSNYAKNLAGKISLGLKSQLHILSVVETPSEISINKDGELSGGMSADTKGLLAEKEKAEVEINNWKKDLPAETKSTVLFGDLLNTIKKYINNNNIDLVIMGTHGVTGIKEKLSGSVTQQVILNNRVPVLSLKCDRGDVDFSDFLIAGNFASKEVMNFDVLNALKKVFNSRNHLLCVNTNNNIKETSD
jgi:nucleotide-binding universal stress UspA family protein